MNGQLFWQKQLLGDVFASRGEMFWIHSEFRPHPELPAEFRALFDFLVDENQTQDPPFRAEILSDDDWYLVDANGQAHPICLPAVHLDEHQISFRWR